MLTLVTSLVFILAVAFIVAYVLNIRFESSMFLISDAIVNTFSWAVGILVMILAGKPRR